MNEKLEQYLYNKYPVLFSEHTGSMKQTCMCWGCSHGNGWFFLLNQLCKQITDYIENQHRNVEMCDEWDKKKKKNGEETIERPSWSKEKIPPVVFNQIKEKFGCLRVYSSGGDSTTMAIIKCAEAASYFICEECGRDDWTVGHTKAVWIKTICSECADTYEKNYKESYKWEISKESKELEKLFKEAVEEDKKNKNLQIELAFEKIKELKKRDKKSS